MSKAREVLKSLDELSVMAAEEIIGDEEGSGSKDISKSQAYSILQAIGKVLGVQGPATSEVTSGYDRYISGNIVMIRPKSSTMKKVLKAASAAVKAYKWWKVAVSAHPDKNLVTVNVFRSKVI